MAGPQLRLQSSDLGYKVTTSTPRDRLETDNSHRDEREGEVLKARVVLIDLSGDREAAFEWARRRLPNHTILAVSKAELKQRSRLEALAHLRQLAPDVVAIHTDALNAQSAAGAMMVFGALAGARRILIGDSADRIVDRSRLGALVIEGGRLVLECAIGYGLVVPLSWLLTAAMGLAAKGKSGRRVRGVSANAPLSTLYIRATLTAASQGGLATHVAGFITGARAQGHNLTILATGGSDELACPQVLIEPSPAIGATRALFELWNNLVFTYRSLAWMVTNGGAAEFDFIYQRYSRFNWTGVVLSLVTRLPLVLEFNGSEVWVSRHWDPVGLLWLLKRFERLNQKAASLIFTVSEVERRNLIGAGVDHSRVVANPNGVDPGRFRPGCGGDAVRRQLGLQDRVVVGFLGTFGPWHGASVLAEAATQVGDQSRCHFLFIGDGDQRPAAEAIIQAAGRAARATFVGRQPHRLTPVYLDACDILVSPHIKSSDGSEFFGSPTKLFEYMAMARPVAASRLGQIAEVIVDGEDGLLVPPGDPVELARALERLASDQPLRSRLGQRARRTVVERFTWKDNAARVFETVRTTLSAR